MRMRRGGIDGLLVALVAASVMVVQADLDAPPRYDGAGYAVLARSLREGRGYRAIDHPDEPRHAHFPPGYPTLLALAGTLAGPSDRAAHAASIACAAGATLAAWRWFRTMYARPAALALGLALAVNWAWTRTGSGIQSEPLFELLGCVAVLLAAARRPRDELVRGLLLGATLGAAMLTRQVGLALLAAVILDQAARGRRRTLATAIVAAGLLVAPWVAWSAAVGREGASRTQAGLLWRAAFGVAATFPEQLVFYAGRIPDQLTAPAVEFATVFGRSPKARAAAVAWAALATSIVLAGWLFALKDPRRRLAGLVGFATLGLLVVWPYTEAGRFLIPTIPCLLVGAVEGLARVARKLGLRRVRTLAARLVLLAALPYSAYAAATADLRLRGDRDPAFDAACAWLRDDAERPGPVLTRHPGEVFLRTGRQALEVETSERPGSLDADPDAIAATIRRYGVAYLVVDSDRYARAVASPLERFAADRPAAVRQVFALDVGAGSVRIFATTPPE
ncbi:glycosyltransferase family 39 protein [Paludisphaera mucosa]|uniref:Glycosyltransferase family 39 protein n=1 Tax=Paludisphaera mucosa TaxID=3030827 RepID=A0ABT6FB75_9BACT|nr:glycosyltransferase family 39 protein [Paludisphaera mucosa]MDG3004633.1 glycosyltransferase family 39 protein [Paludisphaera mucosa]